MFDTHSGIRNPVSALHAFCALSGIRIEFLDRLIDCVTNIAIKKDLNVVDRLGTGELARYSGSHNPRVCICRMSRSVIHSDNSRRPREVRLRLDQIVLALRYRFHGSRQMRCHRFPLSRNSLSRLTIACVRNWRITFRLGCEANARVDRKQTANLIIAFGR